MIRYKSTRGQTKTYTFAQAIAKGIAADGGLFVPERIPEVCPIKFEGMIGSTYQELAVFLLKQFETGLSKKTLTKLVSQAYGTNFDTPQIAPVVPLKDNQYVLELWHGPTLAFKDMALQLMPLFFVEAVKKSKNNYLILVATSGDTGKAALEGYKNKDKISIIVFYPDGRVSPFQERQMVTQEGNNVSVVAVEGNFDDCQRCVKEVFADAKFGRALRTKHKTILSSANSINWGRLVPQLMYYFYGYLQLVSTNVLKMGEEMDVVVPTGNFGNLFAAYYAKKMGLPIKTFLCASNENNVLTDFLQTGVYDIRTRSLVQTPSPSMDILIASNIERLLFLVTGNTEKVSQWMHELQTEKKFTVDAKTQRLLKKEFLAGWVGNETCLANIKAIYHKTHYLMDPHTAVAQYVAEQSGMTKRPLLIASTAHWVKFAPDVYHAFTGQPAKSPDEFSIAEELCTLVPEATLPEQMLMIKKKKRIHAKTCAGTKEAVEHAISDAL